MSRRLAIALLILAVLVPACSDSEPVTQQDREEFCKVMREPPPTGAFLEPSDASQRRRLDEHIAAAEAVAPPDIRNEVTTYRRAVDTYLRSRAAGSPDSETENEQSKAGQAVNDYVDAHCF
jgi:hypothetical protein